MSAPYAIELARSGDVAALPDVERAAAALFGGLQVADSVLAETTPCQRANHVDPARARELVERTFGRFTTAPDAENSAAS